MFSRDAVRGCALSNQLFFLSPHFIELSHERCMAPISLTFTHCSSKPALELGTTRTLHFQTVCMSISFSVCVSLMLINQLIFSHDTEVKFFS